MRTFIAILLTCSAIYAQPFALNDTSTIESTSSLRKQLVGYWRLEEYNSAINYDRSPLGNHLSNHSAPQIVGAVGYGADFISATSSYLSITNGTGLSPTGSFEISAWVRLRSKPAAQMVVLSKWGLTKSYQLQWDNSVDRLRWVAFNGSTIVAAANTFGAPSTNVWLFVQCYFDSVGQKIGISVNNGAFDTASCSSVSTSTTEFKVGAIFDSPSVFWDGGIDELGFWSRTNTTAERTLKYGGRTWPFTHAGPKPQGAVLYGYDAGSQSDVFLDTNYVQSLNAVSMVVNSPTKYSGNPLLEVAGPSLGSAWDFQKNWISTALIGTNYYGWYGATPSNSVVLYTGLATSVDGLTWSKPNLGLVSYDGNTTNNIIIGPGGFLFSVVYDPGAASDRKFVGLNGEKPPGTYGEGAFLFKSPDGTNWTYFLQLTNSAYLEAKSLCKRQDGRWLAYYRFDTIRKIGAFLSDTTAIDGTWTDLGLLITASSIDDQRYSIGAFNDAGFYYGFVLNFNEFTQLINMDLYTSRDGVSWSSQKRSWIPVGSAGTWDAGMILNGFDFIKVSNTWNLYYCGTKTGHSTPNGDSRIGLAQIGYHRVGGITGVGDVITTSFQPTAGLTVNLNPTGGSFQAEVLSTNDVPIAGYERINMDPISSDGYSTAVTWGGAQVPTNQIVRLRFYLNE